MTDGKGDRPEARMQAHAMATVNQVALLLRQAGWEFVAVSIARAMVLPDGTATIPGASTYETLEGLTPALPSLADNLRVLARELDEAYARSACRTRAEGYTHVVSGNGVDARRERGGAG